MTEQEKQALFDAFAAGYCAGYGDTPLAEAFEQWLNLQSFIQGVNLITKELP